MPVLVRIALPIVIVGLLLLWVLAGPALQAGEAPGTPAFYDWSEDSRATFGWDSPKSQPNAIQITRLARRRDSNTIRVLEYMTGGRTGIVDADALALARLNRPPDRLLAEHREGQVLIRFWGERPTAGNAEEFVLRTARSAHLATTLIWPLEPIAVHIDVYSIPEGTAYSLARKVQWKSGRPLELAFFVSGAASPEDQRARIVAHELHHLLSAFFGIGHWTADGAERPNASIGFGEIAATAFASCGSLLADGYLSRPQSDKTIVLNGDPMRPPLTAHEVRRLLAVLRHTDAQALSGYGTRIGGILDTTPVFHVLGSDGERIELHSPQGEQLLALCREFAPDPFRIERWLEDLGQQQTASPG